MSSTCRMASTTGTVVSRFDDRASDVFDLYTAPERLTALAVPAKRERVHSWTLGGDTLVLNNTVVNLGKTSAQLGASTVESAQRICDRGPMRTHASSLVRLAWLVALAAVS